MGAAYSSLGRTKVLYATSLVLLDMLTPIHVTVSVMVIPRYFAD